VVSNINATLFGPSLKSPTVGCPRPNISQPLISPISSTALSIEFIVRIVCNQMTHYQPRFLSATACSSGPAIGESEVETGRSPADLPGMGIRRTVTVYPAAELKANQQNSSRASTPISPAVGGVNITAE
jgi:hypothetical protein